MRLWLLFFLTGSFLLYSSAQVPKIRRDTYLTAYMESHGPSTLQPGEVYAAPAEGYTASAAAYAAPETLSYDYGAPATATANTGYSYAPAEPHNIPENPFEPLHAKLILAFKVLLKILVFKLIVKFLAIICVLFFLPKLSGLGLAKELQDEARRTKQSIDEERLQLMQFVLDSISGMPVVCRTEAKQSPLCRLKRAINNIDQQNSVSSLFKFYVKEEEEKLRHNDTAEASGKANKKT